MPAPNPPSPPSASRRWILTPLKRAGSRSRSSAGRGRVSITIPGLTPARTSRPSGRVAGSKHVCDDYAGLRRSEHMIEIIHRARVQDIKFEAERAGRRLLVAGLLVGKRLTVWID